MGYSPEIPCPAIRLSVAFPRNIDFAQAWETNMTGTYSPPRHENNEYRVGGKNERRETRGRGDRETGKRQEARGTRRGVRGKFAMELLGDIFT